MSVLLSSSISTSALDGQKNTIDHLVDLGWDLEVKGPFDTLLRVASTTENESLVRLLFQCGASVGICTLFGDALQAAAVKSYVSVTRLLLQEGTNPNRFGGHHGTPLQAAAYIGHGHVVMVLLDAGANRCAP